MIDPDAVRDRWLDLQDQDARAELERTCRDAVTETAYYEDGYVAHRAQPHQQQLWGRSPRHRLEQPAEKMVRIGLDAEGRPRLAEAVYDGRVSGYELLSHRDGVTEILDLSPRPELSWSDGSRSVSCDGLPRLDGRPRVEITDHSPELALRVFESGPHRSWRPELGQHWGWTATRFSYDAIGRLMLVEHVIEGGPHRGIAFGGDHEQALAEARPRVANGHASITWDGRLATPEPNPDPAAWQGLAEPLANVLYQAAQNTGLGELAFLDLRFTPHNHPDKPYFLAAAAANAEYERRARRVFSDDATVIGYAYQDSRGAGQLDWLALAPPDLLEQIRRALQSGTTHPLDQELEQALKARGTAARITTAPSSANRYGEDASDDSHLIDGRASLERYLQDRGLDSDEAHRAAQDAAWAIVLLPGGRGATRIGGRPTLPEGTDWPMTDDGRPLTHLATLALDELPTVDDSHALPSGGHLAFFADTDDEGEFWEPIEPGDEDRDKAAVIHTPAGAPSYEPDGQQADAEPVTPTPRLQLRHDGMSQGLDAIAREVVRRAAWAVNGDSSDQLFGWPSVVQEDPREGPEQIALPHLSNEALGDFLDAGDLFFYGKAEDIRACRWDQLTIWPSSC